MLTEQRLERLGFTNLSSHTQSCLLSTVTEQGVFTGNMALSTLFAPSSIHEICIYFQSVMCSSWIIWPLAEPDHGLVEVIFSANGSRTSLLSARVRRQAHYSSILALQASGIICYNWIWHDCTTECITILVASQASSLAPVCALGRHNNGFLSGPDFLHQG